MSKIVCAPRLVRFITRDFARAITLYPFILLHHPHDQADAVLINHERIHIRQQAELLVLPFYVGYLLEYMAGRLRGKSHLQAYLNIRFEQEAFQNEHDLSYLSTRPRFGFRYYKKFV